MHNENDELAVDGALLDVAVNHIQLLLERVRQIHARPSPANDEKVETEINSTMERVRAVKPEQAEKAQEAILSRGTCNACMGEGRGPKGICICDGTGLSQVAQLNLQKQLHLITRKAQERVNREIAAHVSDVLESIRKEVSGLADLGVTAEEMVNRTVSLCEGLTPTNAAQAYASSMQEQRRLGAEQMWMIVQRPNLHGEALRKAAEDFLRVLKPEKSKAVSAGEPK
jgi:hypothetical protein